MSKPSVLLALGAILALGIFSWIQRSEIRDLQRQIGELASRNEGLERRLIEAGGLRHAGSDSPQLLLEDLETACDRIGNLAPAPLEQKKEMDRAEALALQIERLGASAVPALESRFQKPGTLELRRRLLRILGRIDPSRGFLIAESALWREGEDVNVRWAAGSVMKEIDAAKAGPVLIRFLKDHTGAEHPGMSYLIDPLRQIGTWEIQEALLQAALDSAKDPSLRYAAVAAIGDLRMREAVPHLRQIVEGVPDNYLRIHAARSLVLIEPRENCPFLEEQESREQNPGFKTFLGQLIHDRCR